MNDDKGKILQACNNLPAEELFRLIQQGHITLLELIQAGLDDNKLVGLQELIAIQEDEMWQEAQTQRSLPLCRRYLQAYPNGRYAGRCTRLIVQLTNEQPPNGPATSEAAGSAQSAPPSVTDSPQKQNGSDNEDTLWQKVQQQRSLELCGRYLQKYPAGRYAERCAALAAQLTNKQANNAEATVTGKAGAQPPVNSSDSARRQEQNGKHSHKALWTAVLLMLFVNILIIVFPHACSGSTVTMSENDTMRVEYVLPIEETDTPMVEDYLYTKDSTGSCFDDSTGSADDFDEWTGLNEENKSPNYKLPQNSEGSKTERSRESDYNTEGRARSD